MRESLIRIRPRDEALYVSRGSLVLATERDGFIDGGYEHGFFAFETRLLSRYRYLIDAEPPRKVALSNIEQHTWLGYYITVPPGADTGDQDSGSGMVDTASEYTLELRLRRTIGDSLIERATLTNYTQQRTTFRLTIEVDADFADLQETAGERQQHGRISRDWRQPADHVWELTFHYTAENEYSHQGESGKASLERGLVVSVRGPDSPPSYEDGRISFDVDLGPGEKWQTRIDFVPLLEESLTGFQGGPDEALRHRDRLQQQFADLVTGFSSEGAYSLAPLVVAALRQAKTDLASLRLFDYDVEENEWITAAGLPIYLALYGRDTLTAGWQAALLGPEMMKGALTVTARRQGTEENDWRDEQPGRMIHEAHHGPLKVLNYTPLARYYGSITTSAFYPVAVSELWHWTGDEEAVRHCLEPARKTLAWLEKYGDLDGDGFYEYKTKSRQGVKNQAWKDSELAVVYEDGTQVEPPIATCEEQGFAYLSHLHLSEVLWWLGEKDEAATLFRRAEELKKRFNEAFWMEEEGFIAFGLDSRKRQIRAVTSNPGHCLATAVVDSDRARRVADRLFEDDLFSGWGIRSLSDRNPAYNPYSYHRGSIWPVEQGTFALAFMRYSLHEYTQKLSLAQFEAASLFDFYRLPEVFGGHRRSDEQPFPGIYPQANSPQAWSASAVFCFLQAMLGLYPYAPLNMLLLDPHLPPWLPDITVERMRVGKATVTIRFQRREDGNTDYRIEELEGKLHVLRQPSPWSLTATFAERLRDALTSLLPGR